MREFGVAGSFEVLKGYTSTWIAFRYPFISGTYLMAVSFGEAPLFLAGLNLFEGGLEEFRVEVYAKKKAPDHSGAFNKYGSYLLSRIVVQYHRP